MVDPKEKLSGSTSVACWLVELVNVSVLSFVNGTVAGGKEKTGLLELELDPEPQPAAARRRAANPSAATQRTIDLTSKSYTLSSIRRGAFGQAT